MLKRWLLYVMFMVLNVTYAQQISVLVFSKTAGYRHESIEAGKKAMEKMAKEKEWNVTFSEDSSLFNSIDLAQFDVLFFLNTTGDILNEEQQNAMKSFLTKGKGFVGTHSATDTEKDWEWYVDLLGASFASHPEQQKATLHINKSFGHSSIEHLENEEEFYDEWYNFKKPVAQYVNVLAMLDEDSYEGKQMGMEHPIIWYHIYQGAKVFYTGLGHTVASYSDKRLLKQIEEAIEWAADKN